MPPDNHTPGDPGTHQTPAIRARVHCDGEHMADLRPSFPASRGSRLTLRTTGRGRWLVVAPVALLLAACSGAGADNTTIRGIDDIEVASPEDLVAAESRPLDPGEAGTVGGGTSDIPVAEEEEDFGSSVGSALDKFNACTEREGVSFVGMPDRNSSDPVLSDPAYGEALGKCANESKILEVFEEQQSRLAEMTPDEVAEYNAGLIETRDCLLRKGWEWDELAPGENGVLEAGLPSPPGVEDPTKILDDPNAKRDIDECATGEFEF